MKKPLIALLVTVIALLTAAPAAAATQTWTYNDKVFVRTVRAQEPELKLISARTLIKTAKAICNYLEDGGTIYEVLDTALEAGLSTDEAAAITAGAVVFYCPSEGVLG